MPKRNTLKDMKSLATSRGGSCLSPTYINNHTKLLWKCGICGHEWLATSHNIQRGKWCPICRRGEPYTYDSFQKIALLKGGICHKLARDNGECRVELECKEGHKWTSDASSVRSGSWCRLCWQKSQIGKEAPKWKPTHDLGFFQRYAEERRGKALSLSIKKPFRESVVEFKCLQGHHWSARVASVYSKSWCEKCGRENAVQKIGNNFNKHREERLKLLEAIAVSKNGKLISGEYKNTRSVFQFCCSEKHNWESSAASVFSGHWCRRCGQLNKQKTWTEDRYRAHAVKNNGKLVKIEKIKIVPPNRLQRYKITFECRRGHVWETSDESARQSAWCRKCSIENTARRIYAKSYERIQSFVTSRGGTLIDTIIQHSSSRLSVICPVHGKFSSRADQLLQGHWCPDCKFDRLRQIHRTPFFEIERQVKESGWHLLTTEQEYTNTKKITVECSNGHKSTRSFHKILKGQGCGTCFQHRGEAMCRITMEKIFGTSFPKIRPKWLITQRNTRLELDGFCEELKIAFEYQGIQHYQEMHFGQNAGGLIKIQERDAEKKHLCLIAGISLIIIPSFPTNEFYDTKSIINCIEAAILNSDINIPIWDKDNFDPVALTNIGSELAMLRIAATQKNMILLDTQYKGVDYKYHWKCGNCGREKHALVGSIKKVYGCLHCARISANEKKKPAKLVQMKKHAIALGGKCLSSKYQRGSTKYRWSCSRGHEWEASWSNIGHPTNPTWCPFCSHKQRYVTRATHLSQRRKNV